MQHFTTKLFFFFGTTIPLTVSAQLHTESLSNLYQEAAQYWVAGEEVEESDSPSSHKLFAADTFLFSDYNTEILAEELALSTKDWGLHLLSSYVRNFGQGFNDETENFTRDRFALELQWNLLSSGYRDGKIKQKIAANSLKIQQMEEQQYLKERAYGYQYNSIIYLFNKAKINYLEGRLAHLQKQDSIYYTLYLEHLIPYLEVLKVRKLTGKYALLLGDYQDFNREFELIYNKAVMDLDARQLPVYKVLIDQLIDEASLEETSNQILAYTNENVILREQLQHDIRFRVFARRTYTAGALDGFQRNYNSLGVGLNIPVSSLIKSRNKLTELQVNQNTEDQQYKSYHLKKELMNHYYEYEYKLQQYQQMSYEAKRLNEIIRKDQLLEKDTAFHVSKLNSLELLNERGEIELELIGLKEQLYLKLLKIQSLSYAEDMTSYLVEQSHLNDRKLPGDRGAVLKMQDITAYGYDLIKAYLRNGEISIIVSDDLPQNIKEKMIKDGFQLSGSTGQELLRINPSDFESKKAMEMYIRDWMNETGNSRVLFTNLSELIVLEMKTIKKQQQ
ncbi:MAG: hypothetical protein OXH57_09480 [Ekhidna sp.]|nr:hypothetical protein [Ekhidna sp.]